MLPSSLFVACLLLLDAEAIPGPPGLKGDPGPEGVTGIKGFKGFKGLKGFKGDVGLQGGKGDVGVQGPVGPAGPQGRAGKKGAKGTAVGPMGPVGPDGPFGPKGTRGPVGERGPPGLPGSKGDAGPSPVGDPGYKGEVGDKGERGLLGPPGASGPPGFLGPTGVVGDKGLRGVKGEVGTRGPKGDPGPPGPLSPSVANDIDQCAQDLDTCQQKCTNVYGGYFCTCNTGYELNNDSRTCNNVDECSSQSCQYICTDSVGSYSCSCPVGYELSKNRQSCHDINECARNSSLCPDQCANTPGSYSCVQRTTTLTGSLTMDDSAVLNDAMYIIIAVWLGLLTLATVILLLYICCKHRREHNQLATLREAYIERMKRNEGAESLSEYVVPQSRTNGSSAPYSHGTRINSSNSNRDVFEDVPLSSREMGTSVGASGKSSARPSVTSPTTPSSGYQPSGIPPKSQGGSISSGGKVSAWSEGRESVSTRDPKPPTNPRVLSGPYDNNMSPTTLSTSGGLSGSVSSYPEPQSARSGSVGVEGVYQERLTSTTGGSGSAPQAAFNFMPPPDY